MEQEHEQEIREPMVLMKDYVELHRAKVLNDYHY